MVEQERRRPTSTMRFCADLTMRRRLTKPDELLRSEIEHVITSTAALVVMAVGRDIKAPPKPTFLGSMTILRLTT